MTVSNVESEKNYVLAELQTRYQFDLEHAEDAFTRLSRDITVFKGFVGYLRTGQLVLDDNNGIEGYTPKDMVSKYGLEPVGAYLMLSELSVDRVKGEEYLNMILRRGHETIERFENGRVVRTIKGVNAQPNNGGLFPTCPTCQEEADWIEEYLRWYCRGCGEYLEPEERTYSCSKCGGELKWIEEYQRWYCYECQQYA